MKRLRIFIAFLTLVVSLACGAESSTAIPPTLEPMVVEFQYLMSGHCDVVFAPAGGNCRPVNDITVSSSHEFEFIVGGIPRSAVNNNGMFMSVAYGAPTGVNPIGIEIICGGKTKSVPLPRYAEIGESFIQSVSISCP